MSVAQCNYCVKGEGLTAYAIEIKKLTASTVYLFKEQTHPGRVIVASDDHISEPIDLPDDRRRAFFDDVTKTAKAIHALFKPDKINYGAYGDLVRHLHFHLVPKYKDGPEWGDIFAMNPKKVTLTDAQYKELVEKIRKAL